MPLRPRLSKLNDGLTLAHFTHRSQLLSQYRQLIRSTRVLPTLTARLDSLAFYRPEFTRLSFTSSPPPSAEVMSTQMGHIRRVVARVPWAAQMRGAAGAEWGEFERLKGRRMVDARLDAMVDRP